MLYKNRQKFGNLKFLSIHFELLKYTNPPFPIGPGGFGIEITHPRGFQMQSLTPISHPWGIPQGPISYNPEVQILISSDLALSQQTKNQRSTKLIR